VADASYPSVTGPPVDAPPTCYRHQRRPAGVTCTRCDRPICPDCMRAAPVGFQCPDCAGAGRQMVGRTRPGYRLRRFSAGAPVTWSLVAANVVVFAATAVGGTTLGFGGAGDTSPLYRDWTLEPHVIAISGEYYRLLTAMFVHWGLAHLALNMWALVVIGVPLEQALGRARYLAVYLLAGLGGSVATYLLAPQIYFSAGASGAIFGVFGGYAVLAHRLRRPLGSVLIVIVANLVFTFTVSGIDWHAHVGGLIVGALVAAGFVYLRGGRRRVATHVLVVVVASVLLAALVGLRTAQIRPAGTAASAAGQRCCAETVAPMALAASSARTPSR
jgi:membrane associated rhomboid family serine protease